MQCNSCCLVICLCSWLFLLFGLMECFPCLLVPIFFLLHFACCCLLDGSIRCCDLRLVAASRSHPFGQMPYHLGEARHFVLLPRAAIYHGYRNRGSRPNGPTPRLGPDCCTKRASLAYLCCTSFSGSHWRIICRPATLGLTASLESS